MLALALLLPLAGPPPLHIPPTSGEALLVGVTRFDSGSHLLYTGRDAEALGRLLRGEYGLQTTVMTHRLAKGDPFSLRLRMPDEEIAWDDAVHARISFQGHDLDDFIILRSDGTPIYNLAVVSDDVEMRWSSSPAPVRDSCSAGSPS